MEPASTIKNDLENEVIKNKKKGYNTITGFELMTYAMKPEHFAYWAKSAIGDSRLKVQYKAIACHRYTPACV